MPDKKLTDNEIVKALECCKYEYDTKCELCCYNFYSRTGCRSELRRNALDLINRLQEENERLQNILICFMDALGKVRKVDDIDEISLIPLMSELNKQYRAELKAEAYKECIDKIHNQIKRNNAISAEWLREYLDNILKELVGEDK